MSSPASESVIGKFGNSRGAKNDFLQLVDNASGNIFGWIDSDGHLQGSLATGGGGGSTPGGASGTVQYNNSGSLGGITGSVVGAGGALSLSTGVGITALDILPPSGNSGPAFFMSGSPNSSFSAYTQTTWLNGFYGSYNSLFTNQADTVSLGPALTAIQESHSTSYFENIAGLFASNAVNNATSTMQTTGLSVWANKSGNGALNAPGNSSAALMAVRARIGVNGNGNVINAWSFESLLDMNGDGGSGNLATGYGYKATVPSHGGSGTLGTYFSFYSDDVTGSATTPYAFYAAGAGASYFGGQVTFNDKIIEATSHTPSSASDTGTTGQIAWDSGFIYICTATNTWKRVAIATW